MLLAAFDRIYHRTNERIRSASAGRRGTDAIHAMMREILPVSPDARDEAPVVVGYWGRVAVVPTLGSRQAAMDDAWRGMLLEHLEHAVLDGALQPSTPLTAVAELLLSLSASQQIRHVTAPGGVDAALPVALVAQCIDPWRS